MLAGKEKLQQEGGKGPPPKKPRVKAGDISLPEVQVKAQQLLAGGQLGSLTLPEMKCLLKAKGQPVGGKKADILARLQQLLGNQKC